MQHQIKNSKRKLSSFLSKLFFMSLLQPSMFRQSFHSPFICTPTCSIATHHTTWFATLTIASSPQLDNYSRTQTWLGKLTNIFFATLLQTRKLALYHSQNFTINFPCLTIHEKKKKKLSLSQTSSSITLIHIFKLQLLSQNKFWYSFHVAHDQ